MPFATPARHPDGAYVVLEGELVIRPDGVTVENFRSTNPAARYDMQSAWDRARRRIVAWLNAQKRRNPVV